MYKIIPIIIALIAAVVLTSGRININFQHNMHLPAEIHNQNTIIQTQEFFSRKRTTDIYIKDEIVTHKQVQDIVQVLNESVIGDIIKFHMTGYGGDVESVEYLINNIKKAKAHIIMLVEAPVYSGHAYITLSVSDIKVSPFAYIMIHTSSAVDIQCNTVEGKDRGIYKQIKCEQSKEAHLKTVNSLIDSLYVLTEDEKNRIKNGEDVYIHSDDARFNTKGAVQTSTEIHKLYMGSGFFVNSGIAVTAYHVVQNKQNIHVVYNNVSLPAKVLSYSWWNDIAILKVNINTPYVFVKKDNLGDYKGFLYGYPNITIYGKNLKQYSADIITSFNTIYFSNSSTYGGMSGGPITDINNAVVGIGTNGYTSTKLSSGMYPNGYGTNINKALTLLNELGILVNIAIPFQNYPNLTNKQVVLIWAD